MKLKTLVIIITGLVSYLNCYASKGILVLDKDSKESLIGAKRTINK